MFICDNGHITNDEDICNFEETDGDNTWNVAVCPICKQEAFEALQCPVCGQYFRADDDDFGGLCDDCFNDLVNDDNVYKWCDDNGETESVELNPLVVAYFTEQEINELLFAIIKKSLVQNTFCGNVVKDNEDMFAEWAAEHKKEVVKNERHPVA